MLGAVVLGLVSSGRYAFASTSCGSYSLGTNYGYESLSCDDCCCRSDTEGHCCTCAATIGGAVAGTLLSVVFIVSLVIMCCCPGCPGTSQALVVSSAGHLLHSGCG